MDIETLIKCEEEIQKEITENITTERQFDIDRYNPGLNRALIIIQFLSEKEAIRYAREINNK